MVMPWVLGVDPGYISGWALIDPDGKPHDWGQTGSGAQRTTGDVIAAILSEWCPYRPLVLAIEGQHVQRDGGKGCDAWGKTLSTLKTARIRGMWEGLIEAAGGTLFAEDGIQPATWRAGVWGGRWTSEQAKKHAVKMAEIAHGIRIKATHHHVAEALWIGLYAWGEIKQRQRQMALL